MSETNVVWIQLQILYCNISRINYDAFFGLVDISKDAGVNRFIYASSSSVYGIKKIQNVTEELALEPLTDYSKYKAMCEDVLHDKRENGFNTLILRPATVCGYSPRLRLDLTVNILTNHAVNNRKITVFGGEQMRPNIHIEDVTDLYVKSLEYEDAAIDGKVFKLSLLPSGVVRGGKLSVVGNGVVVDPWALKREIEEISAKGVEITPKNLLIAENACLILPLHRELDQARETARGGQTIGTTGRGIGPAYEDKVGRRAIRMCDLSSLAALDARMDELLLHHNALRRGFGMADVDELALRVELGEVATHILQYSGAVWRRLDIERRSGKRILFEGAQGAMLDIDHGTYPYVTSSNTVAGQAAAGSGMGPGTIGYVLGITKAYTTRVGSGPFPTELQDEVGQRLGERGHEFGTNTGRKRRCGWFDAVSMRYSARVNGIQGLAITKLDILDKFSEIKICSSYRVGTDVLNEPPANIDLFSECQPVYETIRGWHGEGVTAGVRQEQDLPSAAREYLDRVEELVGVPISIISTGSDRDDTIIRSESFVASWLPSGS